MNKKTVKKWLYTGILVTVVVVSGILVFFLKNRGEESPEEAVPSEPLQTEAETPVSVSENTPGSIDAVEESPEEEPVRTIVSETPNDPQPEEESQGPVNVPGSLNGENETSGGAHDINEYATLPDEIDNSGFESAYTPGQNDGNYRNDVELTYVYNDQGHSITIGMKNGPTDNFIYINPRCSISSADAVAFYVYADRMSLEYSSLRGTAVDSEFNSGYSNFLILDRTYDTLIPADYQDETSYGVRWHNQPLVDGKFNEGDTIYIRAVRVNDGTLLAVCHATIIYDQTDNTFHLDQLSSGDVLETGALTEKDRQIAVDNAISFIQNNPMITFTNNDFGDEAKRGAVVELVPKCYFTVLFDSNNIRVRRGDFVTCDVYAVNFPMPGYGFITVYNAPKHQILGFHEATEAGSNDLNLQVFGYDAFTPFTQASVFPPIE